MSPRILIIDTEPRWVDFLTQKSPPDYTFAVAELPLRPENLTSQPPFDLAIISSRQMKTTLPPIHASNIPFVIATGQQTTSEAITSYEQHALDYFIKNFRMDQILPRIDQAIAKGLNTKR